MPLFIYGFKVLEGYEAYQLHGKLEAADKAEVIRTALREHFGNGVDTETTLDDETGLHYVSQWQVIDDDDDEYGYYLYSLDGGFELNNAVQEVAEDVFMRWIDAPILPLYEG